jgi:hypothetical protein
MGCVQSQELEESGYPFQILNSIFDASLGKVIFFFKQEATFYYADTDSADSCPKGEP